MSSVSSDRERDRSADRQVTIEKTKGRSWWTLLKRTWEEQSKDNVGIVAAGVAFLSLLAIFPAMSAAVSMYGLVADPASIERQVQSLSGALPPQGRDILLSQLHSLVSDAGGALSIGLVISILVALWSAAGGMKAMMTALTIAYDHKEERSFVKFTLTAIVLTLGFMLLLALTIAIVVIVPALLGLLGLGEPMASLINWLRWPILGAAIVLALALLYYYAPCRDKVVWRWVTWGAAFATALWLVGSILFSIYISNFADYNATYGSIGAVIILLLWLYLGAYAVLLGAELDAVMERGGETKREPSRG